MLQWEMNEWRILFYSMPDGVQTRIWIFQWKCCCTFLSRYWIKVKIFSTIYIGAVHQLVKLNEIRVITVKSQYCFSTWPTNSLPASNRWYSSSALCSPQMGHFSTRHFRKIISTKTAAGAHLKLAILTLSCPFIVLKYNSSSSGCCLSNW